MGEADEQLPPLRAGDRAAGLDLLLNDNEKGKATELKKPAAFPFSDEPPAVQLSLMPEEMPAQDVFHRNTQPAAADVFQSNTQTAAEDVFQSNTQPTAEDVFQQNTQPAAEDVFHRNTQSGRHEFTQAEIDHVLRLGSNTDRHRECIIAAFEKQKPIGGIAADLQTIYHGGNGFSIGAERFAAWYDRDGVHLSRGRSARYDAGAYLIPWEQAAKRIGHLIETGQFATNAEVAEAEGYERRQLSEKIWFLYHDFGKNAQGYLPSLSGIRRNNYPEETAWLAEQLKSPEFLRTFTEEYAAFLSAYDLNHDLLRFRHHTPRDIMDGLHDLSLPRRTFASGMTKIPEIGRFITDDEIDVSLSGGGNVAGGKNRIYAFFQQGHSAKEQKDFLQEEYGIGGRSHALSGSSHSWEDYDGKGIHYRKNGCPDIHLTWEHTAKRIAALVQNNRYLSAEAQAAADKVREENALAEQEEMAAPSVPEDKTDHAVSPIMPQTPEENPYEPDSIPYIICEWSESPVFEDGKRYSIHEFDRLMKQADDEQVAGKNAALKKHGTWEDWYEADDPENERFLGYDKTKFTIVMPDGQTYTERQDIGDGDGGVLDFLSRYPQYQSILPQLREASIVSPTPDKATIEQGAGQEQPAPRASAKPQKDFSFEYQLLDRLRADCEYFLGGGQRNERHLWAGTVREQIAKMRELYHALPEKPDWLTEDAISSYERRMAPRYQVIVYHRTENGFDEKPEYQTQEEAERIAQAYIRGSMETGGLAYDGAAVYDLKEKQYLRIYGVFPDRLAQAQVSVERDDVFQANTQTTPADVFQSNTQPAAEDVFQSNTQPAAKDEMAAPSMPERRTGHVIPPATPQTPVENPYEPDSVPYIICEWSESPVFEDGKRYSIYEFDRLMKQADDEQVAGKNAALKKYGTWEDWYEADDPENARFLGYDKTKFTIVMPDGQTYTERQDIGDGDGGVLDFLSRYPQYQSILQILQQAAAADPSRDVFQSNTQPTAEDVFQSNTQPAADDVFRRNTSESAAPKRTARTVKEIYDQYLPVIKEKVMADAAYQNACMNSDEENARIEADAATRRAAVSVGDTEFLRLYYDLSSFHNRLHKAVFDETYPALHASAEQPVSSDDVFQGNTLEEAVQAAAADPSRDVFQGNTLEEAVQAAAADPSRDVFQGNTLEEAVQAAAGDPSRDVFQGNTLEEAVQAAAADPSRDVFQGNTLEEAVQAAAADPSRDV
ncbi:LPD25 domain-containing protein, partial [Agathobaculum sp. LCP25S3_E8]|uniref:LPD25 domain-containing protein n=1 Tax=Agathobaculum sp. LCP25S3_E8 TaxID=3438735 RepID=UPI003F8E7797